MYSLFQKMNATPGLGAIRRIPIRSSKTPDGGAAGVCVAVAQSPGGAPTALLPTGSSIQDIRAEKETTVNANEHPDDLLANAIIKTMVLVCVRNTKLEDLHAGLVPVTKTGDYSDVTVIDGDGRQIPWNDVSHIDDDAMRELMRQIVDRVYTFQVKAGDPALLKVVEQWSSVAAAWDEPRLDAVLLNEVELARDAAS